MIPPADCWLANRSWQFAKIGLSCASELTSRRAALDYGISNSSIFRYSEERLISNSFAASLRS
jgi:hypothetical protein